MILQNITDTHIVKQWRRFLTQTSNKSSLIEFLAKEWQKQKYKDRLRDKTLFVTSAEKCWKITSSHVDDVPALSSQHEEADGHLLLHAAHAALDGYTSVIVDSADTDVFILCLAFSNQIGIPLYQKCGNSRRVSLVDRAIWSAIGADTCKALVGLHAFTGCDTVSAFAGKGKLRALQILKSPHVKSTFTQLGEQWSVTPELFAALEEFVCQLYATNSGTNHVDELRYNLFCSKKGETESHQLPPCQDCLQKHCLRANYQAAIWRSLQNNPGTPTPVGHGWRMEKEDDQPMLVIDWMDRVPAPEAVLDLLSCLCSRSCKLPSCVCLTNGLKCTDMCRLRNCTNQVCDEDLTVLAENENDSDSEASDDAEDL